MIHKDDIDAILLSKSSCNARLELNNELKLHVAAWVDTDRLEYTQYADCIKDFMDNHGRLQELLQLNIIRLFAVDHLMQDNLYIKPSLKTTVAGCYTCYRGGC